MPSGPAINPRHGRTDLKRPTAHDNDVRAKAAFAAELEHHWQARRPESWVRTSVSAGPHIKSSGRLLDDEVVDAMRRQQRSRRGAFSSQVTPGPEMT
jgi:hypothetical protein